MFNSINKKLVLLTILLITFAIIPHSLKAFEPGLLVNQVAGYGGFTRDPQTEAQPDYQVNFIPRISFLIGTQGDVFISAGLTLSYESKTLSVVPELFRTEFLWRFDNARISAGRIPYEDPLGFIANGLFDGVHFFYDTSIGTFSAGAWYTGLLYKKNAYITITPEDFWSYHTDVDYDDFSGTYFAPRRLLMALEWEHPFIAETAHLNASVIVQADLTGADDPYHSQYTMVKLALPLWVFECELGGGVEIIKYFDTLNVAFAGEAGLYWTHPAPFHNRISFNGRFTSGTVENSRMAAFTPITALPQGEILKAKLSGLSMLSLDYTARLHRTFSAGLTASYFVRSDLGTYIEYPVNKPDKNKNKHFLGAELLARFVWSPLSDLRFNAGAGIFLPSLGNAAPDAGNKYRAEIGVVFALF